MNYPDKLKDPRWQKRRLEILNRDGFACCNCKDDKSTLHVHHKTYSKGRAPWDYPDENLVTLCETCHDETHKSIEQIEAEELAAFKSYLLANVDAAFDKSRTETAYLPYRTFTDAIMDLCVLQIHFPVEGYAEKDKLQELITYLERRLVVP